MDEWRLDVSSDETAKCLNPVAREIPGCLLPRKVPILLPMSELTHRQQAILDFVASQILAEGMPPTLA